MVRFHSFAWAIFCALIFLQGTAADFEDSDVESEDEFTVSDQQDDLGGDGDQENVDSFENEITKRATDDYQKAGLQAHNEYRKKHRVPALTLDSSLSNKAKQCASYYAKRQVIDHSCPNKGKNDGENLHWGTGYSTSTAAVKKASSNWYNEIKKYNFNKPGFKKGTGHFTQLVWKGSRKVGFGTAKNGEKTFVVALYNPGQGNAPNQYSSNVPRATG